MLMQTTKQRVFKHPQWQDAIANTIILTLGGDKMKITMSAWPILFVSHELNS